MINVPVRYCPIISKIVMCRHVLGKISSVKFRENRFIGSRIVTCGQADVANPVNLFSQLVVNVPEARCLTQLQAS
jgi:hypothetical protein